MPPSRKLFAAALIALVVVAGACHSKKDVNTDNTATAEPSATPSASSLGDFQVVGSVDHALVGAESGIDLSNVDTSNAAASTSTASPDAGTGATPAADGGLRLTIDDLSSTLRDSCGVATGEKIQIYWTTSTSFDPATLVSTTLGVEDKLEGNTVGISGTLYSRSGSTTTGIATSAPDVTTPAASPDTTSTQGADCVLIADQIALTQSATLPTPRATHHVTHTATPAPTATHSPTPSATATHSPTPTASTSPSPSPTST